MASTHKPGLTKDENHIIEYAIRKEGIVTKFKKNDENIQKTNARDAIANHKEFRAKEKSFDFKQEQHTQTIITTQEEQRKQQAKPQLLDINVDEMDPQVVLMEEMIALAKGIEVDLRQAMEDDHIDATDSQKNEAVKEVKKACNKALDKDEPVPDLHKTFHAVIPECRKDQFANTHDRLDELKNLLSKIKVLSQDNETLVYKMRKEFLQENTNGFDLSRSTLLQNSFFAESYRSAVNRFQLRCSFSSSGSSRANEKDDVENNNYSSGFSA